VSALTEGGREERLLLAPGAVLCSTEAESAERKAALPAARVPLPAAAAAPRRLSALTCMAGLRLPPLLLESASRELPELSSAEAEVEAAPPELPLLAPATLAVVLARLARELSPSAVI